MRKYRVAGHPFGVSVESPWRFMDYTAPVLERIASARAGEVLPVIPVRAGDEVPSRTFVKSKADLPENWKGAIDLSQYEPFLDASCPDEDLLFTLTVHAHLSQEKEEDILMGSRIVLKEDNLLPWYYVRMKDDGATSYEFFPSEDDSVGIMTISSDEKHADFYPRKGFPTYVIAAQVNTALMLMYTYATASRQTLLLHSSVVRHEGMANLFFGSSGTGKSTHARLWVENIPGCDLINDDNPVLRIIDDKFVVFGSPWSGKTPCYRNTSSEVRALVRLQQGPANEIRQISGLEAFASIMSASSSIKWKRQNMDCQVKTVEKLIMSVPSYHLKCLPDPDAALTVLRHTT